MPKNRIDNFIKNPKKALIKISLPIIIVMIVQVAYSIVDTAFVGRLGADAIAAITFSFPVFFIMIGLMSGIGAGMNSVISRYLGSKQRIAAENSAIHGLIISFIVSLIILLVSLPFIKDIFILFGADAPVVVLGTQYLSIVLYGIFMLAGMYILTTILSSQGDTKTAMKIQLATLITNIILDPIFIYTLGLGVKGAAIATVIAYTLGFFIAIYFIKKKSYVQLRISSFEFKKKLIFKIIKVGIPASLTMILMSLYFIFINSIMADFGTNYVASFGIVSRLNTFAVMPIVAISLSLLTLVSMFVGAEKKDLVKDIVAFGIKVGVIFTSIVGILFFIAPSLFLRIFTPDQNLISLGSAYLRVEVFSFPLIAIGMTIGRSLQGFGLGLPILIITSIRILVFAIPLSYLFVFIFGLSYLSVAIAQIIGGLVGCIIGAAWFFRKVR